eukprot:14147333-Alexandrium_andersonii.AAC.1
MGAPAGSVLGASGHSTCTRGAPSGSALELLSTICSRAEHPRAEVTRAVGHFPTARRLCPSLRA